MQLKDASKFQKVAPLLADMYKKLLAMTKAKPNIKLVRLTGSMRNVLCRQGNEELKRVRTNVIVLTPPTIAGEITYQLV